MTPPPARPPTLDYQSPPANLRPTVVERLFTLFIGLILWVICAMTTLYACVLLLVGGMYLGTDTSASRVGWLLAGTTLAVADFYLIRFSQRHIKFHWKHGW